MRASSPAVSVGPFRCGAMVLIDAALRPSPLSPADGTWKCPFVHLNEGVHSLHLVSMAHALVFEHNDSGAFYPHKAAEYVCESLQLPRCMR